MEDVSQVAQVDEQAAQAPLVKYYPEGQEVTADVTHWVLSELASVPEGQTV